MRDLRKDWHRWSRTERLAAIVILVTLAIGTVTAIAQASALSAPHHAIGKMERLS